MTVSTNGARQNQVSFRLDGANNNDLYTNVNQPFPFPDALQEFSVQTANYSAKYGGNAGGVVNVVTKSGTNDFHGSLFEFNRNAVFNARNFFAAKRDQLKRNQYGGTIGGPVILPGLNRKDKDFFFFGYQGTKIRNLGNTTSAFFPTAANTARRLFFAPQRFESRIIRSAKRSPLSIRNWHSLPEQSDSDEPPRSCGARVYQILPVLPAGNGQYFLRRSTRAGLQRVHHARGPHVQRKRPPVRSDTSTTSSKIRGSSTKPTTWPTQITPSSTRRMPWSVRRTFSDRER